MHSIRNKNQITLKTFIFVSVSLLGTLLLFTACGSNESEAPQSQGGGPGGFGGFGQGQSGQPASVEVMEVTTSSISDQIRSFGTVQAKDVISVNPQVSQRITEVHVDLGDTVQSGQVMAKIYDIPFRDNVEQAAAQLQQSRITFERDSTQFERQRTLHQNNAISTSEFEDAQATFESSRQQYRGALASMTQSREDLENTEITSPIYGVVLERLISVGDLATTGNPAFEVANLSGYETRLHLPMHDWEAVQIGLPVNMRLSNRDGLAAQGVITRISPQLHPDTGLGEVVVTLNETTPSIRQGVLVESRIVLLTKENAVVIPRAPLLERVETYIEPETNTVELNRSYSVFVSQGDSVAVRRDLELGIEEGDRIEVLSGLQPGDRIIVTGHRNLQNNARIRVSQPVGEDNARQGVETGTE